MSLSLSPTWPRHLSSLSLILTLSRGFLSLSYLSLSLTTSAGLGPCRGAGRRPRHGLRPLQPEAGSAGGPEVVAQVLRTRCIDEDNSSGLGCSRRRWRWRRTSGGDGRAGQHGGGGANQRGGAGDGDGGGPARRRWRPRGDVRSCYFFLSFSKMFAECRIWYSV